jgi:hypothetical protein
VSDYRWYRLRERNGKAAHGWVSAQAIAGVPAAAETDPGFPRWGEAASISEHRVDDVAMDGDGSLHTVTETDSGIVYATNETGTWTSETIATSGSRAAGSRARFAIAPRIAVDDGLVGVVFGDRRREAGAGDCAPGPCWDLLGATVMLRDADGWTSTSFKDLTTDQEGDDSGDATAAIVVRGGDVYVSDGRRLAARRDGAWMEETVPLSYRHTDHWGDTNAALAVDAAGTVHVAAMDYLGRQIGYARKDASGWTSSTIDSGRGVLSGIASTADGGAVIGYSSASERYPGELCGGDCAVPSTYHLVAVNGASTMDQAVPGRGWGVLGLDASGAPMVTRWGATGIAWRRYAGGPWQTTSWPLPAWSGSFTSHQEVGGVRPLGLWVLGGDGVVAVVYQPKQGGTSLIEAADGPRAGP